jgi:hypothetical protein
MNHSDDPSETNAIPPSNSFGWPFWIFLIVILFIMAGLTFPMTTHTRRKPDQTEAVSNLRQVGLALFEFEREYGAYPNEETAAKVVEKTKTDLDLSGTSSNALFRQLFAVEITQSEQMFYAKVDGTKKPDGDFSAGKALAPGEVAFGYVAGLSNKGNPARVIAFCPVIPGTDRFDPKPFDGKAVILRIDNSVASLNINKDGHAVFYGGKTTLFETGEGTVWGQNVPDIRYPEIPAASKPSFFQKLFSK